MTMAGWPPLSLARDGATMTVDNAELRFLGSGAVESYGLSWRTEGTTGSSWVMRALQAQPCPLRHPAPTEGRLMPTPDEYAAEHPAARAAEYRQQVDRLRALLNPPQAAPPTPAYLQARRGSEIEGAETDE